MARNSCILLLACLGACSTYSSGSAWRNATFSGTLPTMAVEPEEGRAPEETTLPISAGLTAGPSSFLLGASLDFALDKNLTFGPSLQYGFGDDVTLGSLTGQIKYFPEFGAEKSKKDQTFLPYITGGVGIATLDKEGRSGDSGAVLNIGAGARLLTGDHYRLGSEARWNLLTDELGGERSYISWEVLQVIISF